MRTIALCLAMAMAACAPIADIVDGHLNGIKGSAPAAALPAHADLHRRLFVADLHADTLLWRRDLLERGDWGHVDVPRLRAGGVDLQVFTIVTKTPPERRADVPGTENDHCIPGDGINTAGVLGVLQGRPPATWSDLRARALYQAGRLDEAAARSRNRGGTELMLIRTADDLARLIGREHAGDDVVGAILGVEGANWIGGPHVSAADVRAEVRALHEAGVRSLALTHRFDNALAGSSEGCGRTGLSDQGRVALEEAQALGMVIDLAHISQKALRTILDEGLLHRPPIVSHTGLQGSCPRPSCYAPRNLSDDELTRIARKGGVIGIGFWPEAVGGGGTQPILDAIAHAAGVLNRAGLDAWDYLAFGSDYDGAVDVPFDVAHMPAFTRVLVTANGTADPVVPRAALPRIAGANVCRVFAETLPGGGVRAAARICAPLRAGPVAAPPA